ncbi:MAG TPA: hypothetical protein VFR02_00215 [bacterium]|nr:hypothetical protein [bacterium]
MAKRTTKAKAAPKLEVLTWKKGWTLFAACWLATFLAVWGLRQVFIPKEELDCYARVQVLQKAVDQWNAAHPDQAMTDSLDPGQGLDEAKLTAAGLMPAQTYDHNRHYYFIDKTPHGLKVKCNKDEDNPLILRLVGDTLLAALVFVFYCSGRGLVLFKPV